MPWASRTTCTSPERPGSSREPVVCGNGRRTSTVTTTVATTRSSTSAAATYVVTRAARGQPRKVRHQSPGPERAGSDVRGSRGRGIGLVAHGVRHCAVPYDWQSPGPSASPTSVAVPTRGPRPTDATEENRADLPVRLHRVRPRLRAVPELLRRRPDRSAPSATGGCARCSTPWASCSRAPASTAPTAGPRDPPPGRPRPRAPPPATPRARPPRPRASRRESKPAAAAATTD